MLRSDATASLIEAARTGDVETIRRLATRDNVNATTQSGDTALIEAALRGHTDAVRALLAAGATMSMPPIKMVTLP